MGDQLGPLRGEQFAVLTTYRRSGEAVPTTVWFADDGDRLYVTTASFSGKVRRLQADPRASMAASDQVGNVHGPAVAVRGRVLGADAHGPAVAALERKYGDVYRATVAQMDAQREPGTRVFLELVAE